MTRPPERWSSVIAVIAVDAGVRAGICATEVPSLIRDVAAPHQASGVNASDPYASAVHIESKPSRSASAICSTTPPGGPALFQYPMISPSFMLQVYRTGGICSPAVEVQDGEEGGRMRRRNRRIPLIVVIALSLLSTACGARLDRDQVAAVNNRGAAAQQAAPAKAGPAAAAAKT